MLPTYQLHEIVWAKVIGYPWWPATISGEVPQPPGEEAQQYLVHFFGEDSYCQIAGKRLAKYLPNCQQFKQCSTGDRRLRDSILAADRIVAGLTNVAAELARLRAKAKSTTKKGEKKKLTGAAAELIGNQTAAKKRPSDTTSLNDQLSLERPLQIEAQHGSSKWDQENIEQELLLLQPHEDNIVALLENGLLGRLKCLSEEKASRHRRILKKLLVKRYFRRADEGHRRRPLADLIQRTKPIQKAVERLQPSSRSLKDVERLCVLKLYSTLKQLDMERNEAQLLSVRAVKRMQ